MAKKTKAEKLLSIISDIEPGKSISWPAYDGDNILDANTMEGYVMAFFKSGELMPIPFAKGLGLNIFTVRTEQDVQRQKYLVIIEGTVTKLKGEEK